MRFKVAFDVWYLQESRICEVKSLMSFRAVRVFKNMVLGRASGFFWGGGCRFWEEDLNWFSSSLE